MQEDNSVHIGGSIGGSAVVTGGSNARVHVVHGSPDQVATAIEAVAELQRALQELPARDEETATATAAAEGNAAKLERELRSPQPDRSKLGTFLAGVVKFTAGLATVTGLVEAVKAAVGTL